MALIAAEQALLESCGPGYVRRKANRTAGFRATLGRLSRNVPETLVKITGFEKRGAGHVAAHLDYISRRGKVELETDKGELLQGREAIRDYFLDWKADFDRDKAYQGRRDTMKLVLSMPAHIEPEDVRDAVRDFAKQTFGGRHEYVFVLHTDEAHPHCHLTVKCKGYNGKRLHVGKDTAQRWREQFAEALGRYGVEAEATPRRLRGVVQKAEPSAVWHIDREKGHGKQRVSRIRAMRVKQAAERIIAQQEGRPCPEQPWEARIAASQAKIRQAWRALEASLEHAPQSSRMSRTPAYEQIDPRSIYDVQRRAALYQSRLANAQPSRAALAVAGLRDLPGLDVASRRNGIALLLPANAHDRLEHDPGPGHGLRRAGTGAYGTRAAERRLAPVGLSSAQLDAFLKAQPPPLTRNQALEAGLRQQFAKAPAKELTGGKTNRVAERETTRGYER